MAKFHLHKVDPRLRRAAGGKGEDAWEVFIEVANAEVAKWVRKQPGVRKFVQVVDGYFTAAVRPDCIDRLAAHQGVIEIEKVRFHRLHLVNSRPSIHGDQPMPGGGGVPDGRGVVTGFVDYGLDFTQKDFQNPPNGRIADAHNPRGITRIAYLWDQQLKRKAGERQPAKYGYGVEYTSADIDRALRRKRPGLIRHNPLGGGDTAGHGTHVAGIAAGNGETSDDNFHRGKYVGIAPAATIVFVNLNRSEIVGQVNSPRGTLANSVNIAHGVAYCFEKADELGLPCVVNLSLGCNGGGHDGDMVLEWIIDALLQKSGRAVVIAAGNEDGAARPVHATGTLKQDEETGLEWKVGSGHKNDPNPNELEVWYPRGNAIKVSLVAPGDGQSSEVVEPGGCGDFRYAKGEQVTIYSDLQTPWHGAARIHITLKGAPKKKGIRCGTWIVKLQALKVAHKEAGDHRVRYHGWIERTLPAAEQPEEESRFAHYDPHTAINVTTPGTARFAITVASCKNDGSLNPPVAPISGFSGRGPTRDERHKPELAAPGDAILSTGCLGRTGEDGKAIPARVSKQGTSQAAPHVAGVVARMLSRNAYLTAAEIRDILVKSATPPASGAGWDAKSGHGMLNAARAVDLVEHLAGKPRAD